MSRKAKVGPESKKTTSVYRLGIDCLISSIFHHIVPWPPQLWPHPFTHFPAALFFFFLSLLYRNPYPPSHGVRWHLEKHLDSC
ncbi:hypothetical protein QBC40DRAFT_278721 [Triangularia verruculosa]|uniref:Uncharacterized protein n=1 Tax=Triangularia verruculosa TaxID=2587418 RepID=A0AAN6XKF5_9PEZI|nr:hypothetical protein QBC40DRAFT_278721 [Triangularia verruculosa]